MDHQKEIEEALQDFGLTKTETIIFLTLLREGASTSYKISKNSKLYKANTYQSVENLIAKGVVTSTIINNKKIITAVPPEQLLTTLELKKEKIQTIIPLISQKEDTVGIHVQTGLQSLMNTLYSLLEKKEPIYAYDIPKYVPSIVRTHINHFHNKRIDKKVPMYHIYDYDAKERISYLNKMKLTYAKSTQTKRNSLTSTIICGDVTLIINWMKDIKIIYIQDKDITQTNKQQFDILWNTKK